MNILHLPVGNVLLAIGPTQATTLDLPCNRKMGSASVVIVSYKQKKSININLLRRATAPSVIILMPEIRNITCISRCRICALNVTIPIDTGVKGRLMLPRSRDNVANVIAFICPHARSC